LGHTIYYITEIDEWGKFLKFMKDVCNGLGLEAVAEKERLTILPGCMGVEPLKIPRKGYGFAKTNKVEPCHSVYRLVLYSLASFGSVSVWED